MSLAVPVRRTCESCSLRCHDTSSVGLSKCCRAPQYLARVLSEKCATLLACPLASDMHTGYGCTVASANFTKRFGTPAYSAMALSDKGPTVLARQLVRIRRPVEQAASAKLAERTPTTACLCSQPPITCLEPTAKESLLLVPCLQVHTHHCLSLREVLGNDH